MEDDLLFRRKNIRFFLNLDNHTTARAAAMRSGISPQHAVRLLNLWDRVGYIEKGRGANSGCKYTHKGWELFNWLSSRSW